MNNGCTSFSVSQRLKKKQRVLEISREFIAKGYKPALIDVAAQARIAPQICRKMQAELQQEGLLVIPDGLRPVPAKQFYPKRSEQPKQKTVKAVKPTSKVMETPPEVVKPIGPICTTRQPDKPVESHKWRHVSINPERDGEDDARERRKTMIREEYLHRMAKRK